MIRLRPEQVWTCNVHTCSGRNRIIPLMRRPNTDSTPNKPVTLPQNQPTLDTLRGHESRPHCHDTVLRYAVTLQVCAHPKSGRSCASCITYVDSEFASYRRCLARNEKLMKRVY